MTKQLTLTKADLIDLVADRAKLPRGRAELLVGQMFDCMVDALQKGDGIEIRGFGSFSISRRPPRVGRNPRSGEQVTIPEKLVPHFKPGKALREAVDQELPAQDKS